MYIHREGRNSLIIITLLLIIAIFLPDYLQSSKIISSIIILPFLILWILILWFFRVPKRICKVSSSQIIAPADGKVVVIEKTKESEYFKNERIQISIFMSPLNVHQNVYPISGKVSYTKYHKGKYLVAWHPKSSTLNERSTVVVKNENGVEILFRQIAGAVARRICTYSKVGENAEQGQEMGFIKFGSRVDIFLPVTAKILCNPGDITQNKLTILAEL